MRQLTVSLFIALFLTGPLSWAQNVNPLDIQLTFGEQSETLNRLDEATGKKWENLIEWQNNTSWINEQVRLGVVGVIYEKGLFGASVSRNIIPDQKEGWLVADTVSLGAGPLLTTANLLGNLFFQEVFPYLQVKAIADRSFVNIRHADTYKEALLAPVFSFKRLPSNEEGFRKMAIGEMVSTITTGGVHARAGVGLFDMLGIDVNTDVTIGPKAKLYLKKNFKLTLSKESESKMLVMIEKVRDVGAGVGLSLGVDLDEIIDAPVSIGINGGQGFTPIQFNYKANHSKVKSIIYSIDLATELGRKAFEVLLSRDFADLDEIVDLEDESVKREFHREGKVLSTELNAGLNLILFRSGFRNIFVNGKYASTLSNGEKFEYQEVSLEKINEAHSFFGGRKRSEKYSALIPKGEKGIGTFVMDSTFQYAKSEADGKDVSKMLKQIRKTMNHFPLYYEVGDKDKDYGDIRIEMRIRFTPEAMKRIFKSSEKELWEALAISAGISDPEEWATETARQSYKEEYQRTHKLEEPCAFDFQGTCNEAESYGPKSPLDQAKAVVQFMAKLKSEEKLGKKAKKLIRFLKKDRKEKLLHRSLVELGGRDKLLIRGFVKGQFL